MWRFMTVSIFACIVVLSFTMGAARATESASSSGARYTMTPTEDGALRLDTETGEVSHCRQKVAGWACELVADDRKAYEREITALEKRIARLETRKGDARAEGDLPTEEELDEAFGFFDSLMARFVKLIKKWGPELEELEGEEL